jgi:hypothetical protein
MGIYAPGSPSDILLAQTVVIGAGGSIPLPSVPASTPLTTIAPLVAPITLIAGTKYLFAIQGSGQSFALLTNSSGTGSANRPQHTGTSDNNPNFADPLTTMLASVNASPGSVRPYIAGYQ